MSVTYFETKGIDYFNLDIKFIIMIPLKGVVRIIFSFIANAPCCDINITKMYQQVAS